MKTDIEQKKNRTYTVDINFLKYLNLNFYSDIILKLDIYYFISIWFSWRKAQRNIVKYQSNNQYQFRIFK